MSPWLVRRVIGRQRAALWWSAQTPQHVRIEPSKRWHEVQLGKRTGRKRGAPFGNANRLTHGRYAAAALARRRTGATSLQEARLLEAWTRLLTRIERARRAGVDLNAFHAGRGCDGRAPPAD